MEKAHKAGAIDGLVAGSQPGYCDCDPRGAFIRRPELPESDWKVYEDAYTKAFMRGIGRRAA